MTAGLKQRKILKGLTAIPSMKLFSVHLVLLLKKLGIAFLVFSLCRILFYIFNVDHFHDVTFGLFFFGIRFDLVAISFLFAPLVVFQLLPFSFRNFKWYSSLLSLLFFLPNTAAIIFNLIDVAYFDFTLRRTGSDFFGMIATGSDFLKLLPNYVIDFWYDYLLLIGLITLSWWLHKKFCLRNFSFYPYTKKDYLIHSTIFILSSGIMIIGMRGGIQYKPLNIINAAQYAKVQNIPIVLNTPFVVMKTISSDKLIEVAYFSNEELEEIYTPQKHLVKNGMFSRKNVVIIILESFAKEFVGWHNGGVGYTPFLDSLMNESYVFTQAYANAQRSIESLPCILAGIPQLMNSAYVLSPYSGNKLDGVAQILGNMNYNTSFYHGGANGTMGFNGFTRVAGIGNYYGLNEYPNKDKDFDGHWGIYDRPYLQYYASELNKKAQPFFSSVFTISSHHPYTLPPEEKNIFPKGTMPIHETIGYTDNALKKFFETAKESSWFKNTLFLFTADHSTHSSNKKYQTRLGRYAIPTFIFDPSGKLKGENNNYFQQIDISPTLLSLLGVDILITTFGNSAFDENEKFVINYTNGTFQLVYKEYLLFFDGNKSTNFFNINDDPLLTNDLLGSLSSSQQKRMNYMEQLVKGIIQQYNTRIINNSLSAN